MSNLNIGVPREFVFSKYTMAIVIYHFTDLTSIYLTMVCTVNWLNAVPTRHNFLGVMDSCDAVKIAFSEK